MLALADVLVISKNVTFTQQANLIEHLFSFNL